MCLEAIILLPSSNKTSSPQLYVKENEQAVKPTPRIKTKRLKLKVDGTRYTTFERNFLKIEFMIFLVIHLSVCLILCECHRTFKQAH